MSRECVQPYWRISAKRIYRLHEDQQWNPELFLSNFGGTKGNNHDVINLIVFDRNILNKITIILVSIWISSYNLSEI